MKKIFFFLFCFIGITSVQSQVLTQDSKGNSSVLYNGSNIGFDITEAAINFSFNKFQNEVINNKNKHLVWGFNFQAKNADGYANLFNEGILSPAAKGNITIGGTLITGDEYYKDSTLKRSLLDIELKELQDNFISNIKKTIDGSQSSDNQDTIKILKREIYKIIESMAMVQWSDAIKKLNKSLSKENGNFIESIAKSINDSVNNYIKISKVKVDERLKVDHNIRNLRGYYTSRLAIFFTGGFTSSAFKIQNEIDTTNLNNSFKNQGFLGYDFKIGLNWHYTGRWLFAGTIGYKQNNTFDLLTKTEYTLTTTINSGNQQLAKQKKITAYSGDYSTFNQTKFEIDILRFIKMDDNVLVMDLYFRSAISDDTAIYPNLTDLGLSAYFFKNNGVFIGGLYIEAPDINNNLEKTKENPNIKPIQNKLNFGIVGKINIGSVFGY